MKDAKRVAREFHEAFTPTRVASTGFEVVQNLTGATNTAAVLSAVADWHKHPRRRGARHAEIANRLVAAADSQNDSQFVDIIAQRILAARSRRAA